jgi:hypothetical protein
VSEIQIPVEALDGGILLGILATLGAMVFVAIIISLWLDRQIKKA